MDVRALPQSINRNPCTLKSCLSFQGNQDAHHHMPSTPDAVTLLSSTKIIKTVPMTII